MFRDKHLIICDYGEIEAPDWFVDLWEKADPVLTTMNNRKNENGYLRVSLREAFAVVYPDAESSYQLRKMCAADLMAVARSVS